MERFQYLNLKHPPSSYLFVENTIYFKASMCDNVSSETDPLTCCLARNTFLKIFCSHNLAMLQHRSQPFLPWLNVPSHSLCYSGRSGRRMKQRNYKKTDMLPNFNMNSMNLIYILLKPQLFPEMTISWVMLACTRMSWGPRIIIQP